MSKTIILSESAFKRLLNEEREDYLNHVAQNYAAHEDWYNSHRNDDGKFNMSSIAQECLDLLRRGKIRSRKDVFTSQNSLITLTNDCRFYLRSTDMLNDDFSLWEIWVPSGESFDGEDVDEELDYEIQEELAKHSVK